MPTISLLSAANAAAAYLHVLDSGESLSSQQLTDALLDANNILDDWSTDKLMLPGLYETAGLPTLANQDSYSVGPLGSGAAWVLGSLPANTPALALVGAQYNFQGYQQPLRILTNAEWNNFPDRRSSTAMPKGLYYNRQAWVVDGLAYLAPLPSSVGSVSLSYWGQFVGFPNTAATITVPTGYSEPFIITLAQRMAPRFHLDISATLAKSAMDSMARIRNLNAQLYGTEPPSGQSTADSQPPAQIAPSSDR